MQVRKVAIDHSKHTWRRSLIFLLGLFAVIMSKSATAQTEKVLYSFSCPNQYDASDGCLPLSGVLLDSKGNIYGTPEEGGTGGGGTVFNLTRAGKETVLYNFQLFSANNGYDPGFATVVMDKSGNLYGTTFNGGAYPDSCNQRGCGIVYKITLTPTPKESVLASFDSGLGGPDATLLMDVNGSLYGTTEYGGKHDAGTIFKLTPADKLSVLFTFDGTDGSDSEAPLIRDKEGNLYGTTYGGGTGTGTNCAGANGCGTVFKLANGHETVLYNFNPTNGKDGFAPSGPLAMDGAGNLYGTTLQSGGSGCYGGCNGTVFKVTPSGIETVLHTFPNDATDGYSPWGGVIIDKLGNLYGTTLSGGSGGCGTVFKLTPDNEEVILHNFTCYTADGTGPYAGLTMDEKGNLYGTTSGGGTGACLGGCGTVFEVIP